MANFNCVILMGNLTRDPELRYSQQGKAVCSFDLAVNEHYTTQDGGKKESVLFIKVTVWGRTGEACAEHLKKGSLALVEGRLRMNQWQTKEGQKRSSIEVVAQRVQFLPKTDKQAVLPEQRSEEDQPNHEQEEEENIPF